MKSRIGCILFFVSVFLTSRAQELKDTFQPQVKQGSQALALTELPDGNYLVSGNMHYYENSPSGSLIKIDQYGKRVPGFQQVSTDDPIATVKSLPSGKILIAGGFHYLNGTRVGSPALLNADGSVDESFHVSENLTFAKIALQSDGKILGMRDNEKLVRLNTDGSVDAGFSPDLRALFYFTANFFVDPSDRIYVLGFKDSGYDLKRLTPEGEVDETFQIGIELGYPYSISGPVVFQPDGKMLISMPMQDYSVKLYRLQTDGTLDNAFHVSVFDSQINGIAVRKNGKVAVTGIFRAVDSNWGNTVELSAEGVYERTFFFSDASDKFEVVEDSHENIFVSGTFSKLNNLPFKFMVKIKPDYSLDEQFALPVYSTAGRNAFLPMGVQSNGNVLVAVDHRNSWVQDNESFLARLFPDGTVDQSFTPEIQDDDESTYRYIRAIAVQDDDKILLGGANIFVGSSTFGRLTKEGVLDPDFQPGSGPQHSSGYGAVNAIKVKNSKLYLIGNFDSYDGHPCQGFVILNDAGEMTGPEKLTLPKNSDIYDAEIQTSGKIVLTGSFPFSPTDTRTFLRLNADGSIDNTFSLALENMNPDIEIDADDRIVVRGNSNGNGTFRPLLRFDKDGHADNTFNTPALLNGVGFTTYYHKVLPGKRTALGGYFREYKRVAPCVVILDDEGTPISMPNALDSTSFLLSAAFGNNTLYMLGQFSRDHGQSIVSGASIVFSDTTLNSFTVKATSESTMSLHWKNSVKNATHTRIERSTPDATHYEVVADVNASEQSYTATGLVELTPYYFRITSSNSFYQVIREGYDSTSIALQPALPATEITGRSFVANWTPVPATDSCLLQVSADNFATFVNGYDHVIVEGAHAKAVAGLQDGKTYQYRVKRYRGKKTSPFSEVITVDVVVGVEQAVVAEVNVFPNPAYHYLSVRLPANPGTASARVQSMQGETLVTYPLVDGALSQLDIRSLPAGVFVLTVSMNGRTQNFRFIKSH